MAMRSAAKRRPLGCTAAEACTGLVMRPSGEVVGHAAERLVGVEDGGGAALEVAQLPLAERPGQRPDGRTAEERHGQQKHDVGDTQVVVHSLPASSMMRSMALSIGMRAW